MTTRVLFDPNVLISAVITPTGISAKLVDAVRAGTLRIVVSPALLDELAGVLNRPRFRKYLTTEQADRYVQDLAALGDQVPDPLPPHPAVTRDPNDDYLIAIARAAGIDTIISGDLDLTTLTETDLQALTPRQFLDQLETGSG